MPQCCLADNFLCWTHVTNILIESFLKIESRKTVVSLGIEQIPSSFGALYFCSFVLVLNKKGAHITSAFRLTNCKARKSNNDKSCLQIPWWCWWWEQSHFLHSYAYQHIFALTYPAFLFSSFFTLYLTMNLTKKQIKLNVKIITRRSDKKFHGKKL